MVIEGLVRQQVRNFYASNAVSYMQNQIACNKMKRNFFAPSLKDRMQKRATDMGF